MSSTRFFVRGGTVLVAASILFPFVGAPAGEVEGITVSGTGEILAKPSRVEIEVTAHGSAELSGDALVKYRSAYQRMIDAYKRLKLANLEIEEQDTAITSPTQQVNLPGAPQPAKAEIQISGTLKVALTGIQAMSKDELSRAITTLLDTAKDSGASVGTNKGATNYLQMVMAAETGMGNAGGMVLFVVEDANKVREQAYQKASADARGRAERLAALAGVKLGPVLSLRESTPAADAAPESRGLEMMFGMAAPSARSEDGRITSPTLKKIPVRVSLTIRYAIAK